MKHITYDGGTLEIALPDDWTLEEEEDAVTALYSPADDSGVLRVRARTYHNPDKSVTSAGVIDLLGGMARRLVPDREHEIEPLTGGNLLVTYLQTFPDESPPLVVAAWLVGIPVPPRHVQMLSFTYTVPGQFAGSPATIEELELVEEAIRVASYRAEV